MLLMLLDKYLNMPARSAKSMTQLESKDTLRWAISVKARQNQQHAVRVTIFFPRNILYTFANLQHDIYI
jgi:hypothetical protein